MLLLVVVVVVCLSSCVLSILIIVVAVMLLSSSSSWNEDIIDIITLLRYCKRMTNMRENNILNVVYQRNN